MAINEVRKCKAMIWKNQNDIAKLLNRIDTIKVKEYKDGMTSKTMAERKKLANKVENLINENQCIRENIE